MMLKCHQLDDFFENTKINFDRDIEVNGTKYSERFYQHVIIVNDISGFVDHIVQQRNLNNESIVVRIGLDGGGGFFKVCLSVYDLDAEEEPPVVKTLSKNYIDTGVKKVFIIGITPDVPEKYANVKKVCTSIGLSSLNRKFSIATDLKLCNILLGLMSHASRYPCCWCDIDKNNLDKKGNQRTFKSLDDMFWAYFSARVPQSEAKEYGNVAHRSIIEGIDENTPVFQVVPPPELHLMLGPVNHMYDKMNNVWPGSDAWLKACFVKKEEYHGGQFEGNDCRKLLKKIDLLREICPEKHQDFVRAFSTFNNVVASCYGKTLHENYKRNIAKFKAEYLKLNISVTPKVHAVLYHVAEFCDWKKMGLVLVRGVSKLVNLCIENSQNAGKGIKFGTQIIHSMDPN